VAARNKKIKNATVCTLNNLSFKSKLEKTTYTCLQELDLNPQYEPKTFVLWDSFNPLTPFYDKETNKQRDKRIAEGSNEKSISLTLKKNKILGIKYTPDFYLRYKDLDVYIETKGIENDAFYLKKKLFIKYLDNVLLNTGQHSIYFEVYTKKQLMQAVSILKEYEQSISEHTNRNTVSS
jgi:hypothetical protein